MLLKTHVGRDLCQRNCRGQVSHAHQIVGGTGQGEDPVHLAHPAMANLPHERYRLQPAEAFFDPFSLFLTEGVTRVPRGAAIYRAAPASRKVLCHMPGAPSFSRTRRKGWVMGIIDAPQWRKRPWNPTLQTGGEGFWGQTGRSRLPHAEDLPNSGYGASRLGLRRSCCSLTLESNPSPNSSDIF